MTGSTGARYEPDSKVIVSLHSTYDDAWDEIVHATLVSEGGVPSAPLLTTDVIPMLGQHGVVTQYLAPDRATDARDAAAAGRVVKRLHAVAFAGREHDGTSLVLRGLTPRNFVVHQGALHLVDFGTVERHSDRASARLGAASDFASGVTASERANVRAAFLAAYDKAHAHGVTFRDIIVFRTGCSSAEAEQAVNAAMPPLIRRYVTPHSVFGIESVEIIDRGIYGAGTDEDVDEPAHIALMSLIAPGQDTLHPEATRLRVGDLLERILDDAISQVERP